MLFTIRPICPSPLCDSYEDNAGSKGSSRSNGSNGWRRYYLGTLGGRNRFHWFQ